MFSRAVTVILILMLNSAMVASFADADDSALGNLALRNLHQVARATVQGATAAKDNDTLGCQEGFSALQQSAHESLGIMHSIAPEPINAIKRLGDLLRLSELSADRCTANGFEPMIAGQVILGLRTDFAIGVENWYMVDDSGNVVGRNPLKYEQELRNANYSWVDVRLKAQPLLLIDDWKAEMQSTDVADSKRLGREDGVNEVELGYRKAAADSNSTVYFYRTREAALKAKNEVEAVAKDEAQNEAARNELQSKLLALPYITADNDIGFKIQYAVCKPNGKTIDGVSGCDEEGSHDWSDTPSLPYSWYADIDVCTNALFTLHTNSNFGHELGGNPIADCIPAKKPIQRNVKGYTMLVETRTLSSSIYVLLKRESFKGAIIFRDFKLCSAAMDPLIDKLKKTLGKDADDNYVADNIILTCSRAY